MAKKLTISPKTRYIAKIREIARPYAKKEPAKVVIGAIKEMLREAAGPEASDRDLELIATTVYLSIK